MSSKFFRNEIKKILLFWGGIACGILISICGNLSYVPPIEEARIFQRENKPPFMRIYQRFAKDAILVRDSKDPNRYFPKKNYLRDELYALTEENQISPQKTKEFIFDGILYKIDMYKPKSLGRYSNDYIAYVKQEDGTYIPLSVLEAEERGSIIKDQNGSFKTLSENEWKNLDALLDNQREIRRVIGDRIVINQGLYD